MLNTTWLILFILLFLQRKMKILWEEKTLKRTVVNSVTEVYFITS